MDPKNSLEYEVRLKNPLRGMEADYQNGRSSAIDLFCLACMGSSIGSVTYCKSYSCALWRFRPGNGSKERPKGYVPTLEEYTVLAEKKKSVAKIEAGKKLAERNKK